METEQKQARAELVATPARNGGMAIIPQSFEQVWRYSQMLAAAGDMVPECYRGNPEAVALAVMWAMELGISPIQAVQGIAPIKGRPAVWGDLALALTMQHPDYEDLIEEPMLDVSGVVMGYRVTAKRKGRDPKVREFTIADAVKAGLVKRAQEKGGPWRDYPQRMLQMRARSWAIRDAFPDALRGLYTAEEAQDIVTVDARTAPRLMQAESIYGSETASVRSVEPDHVPMPTARTPDPLPDPQATELEPASAEAQGQPVVDSADKPQPVSGDLLPREDAPPERKPLGKAQAATIRAFIDTLEGAGISEQDLFDELGDSVHAGNFAQAVNWCESKLRGAR